MGADLYKVEVDIIIFGKLIDYLNGNVARDMWFLNEVQMKFIQH